MVSTQRRRQPQHARAGRADVRTWVIGGAVALVFVKLIFAMLLIGSGDSAGPIPVLPAAEAVAQDAPAVPAPAGDGAKAGQAESVDNGTQVWDSKPEFQWSYRLVQDLRRRDEQLRTREELLAGREDRLARLQQAVQERLAQIETVQKNITAMLEETRAVENEKVKKLAKVFEETPPEQAGPLLSRLDVDIAAELLLKMTGRKAGRIWGYVDPDQAVKISKELARIQPGFTMQNIMGQ